MIAHFLGRRDVLMEERTCQGCGSKDIKSTVRDDKRKLTIYHCVCGHVSYYFDGEKNWRVG
jgi:hypothetical protein